jgi:hypothetical protein
MASRPDPAGGQIYWCGTVSTRDVVLRARKALLNGGDKLSYFEGRGLTRDTIAKAFVGYEANVSFPGNKGRGYRGPAFFTPA